MRSACGRRTASTALALALAPAPARRNPTWGPGVPPAVRAVSMRPANQPGVREPRQLCERGEHVHHLSQHLPAKQKSGKKLRVGIFLDFASSSTRTEGPHGASWGVPRTCRRAGEIELAPIGVELNGSQRVPPTPAPQSWPVTDYSSAIHEPRAVRFRLLIRTHEASHTHAGPQYVQASQRNQETTHGRG